MHPHSLTPSSKDHPAAKNSGEKHPGTAALPVPFTFGRRVIANIFKRLSRIQARPSNFQPFFYAMFPTTSLVALKLTALLFLPQSLAHIPPHHKSDDDTNGIVNDHGEQNKMITRVKIGLISVGCKNVSLSFFAYSYYYHGQV
jgi:hypothetical protein